MVNVICPTRLDAMALTAQLRTQGFVAERRRRGPGDVARRVTVDSADTPDSLRDQVRRLTPAATITIDAER